MHDAEWLAMEVFNSENSSGKNDKTASDLESELF
jgi:hypothetical protein